MTDLPGTPSGAGSHPSLAPGHASLPASKKSGWRGILSSRSKEQPADSIPSFNQVRSAVVGLRNKATSRSTANQSPVGDESQSTTDTTSAPKATPSQVIGVSLNAPISELWNEAWEELLLQETHLAKEYDALLEHKISKSAKSVGLMAAMIATPSLKTKISSLGKLQKAEVLTVLLEEKIEELDKGTWKLRFGKNEFAVKEFVGPVVGVISWSKDFIGSATQASPYASLAWAGVSLLLPLVLNPGKQDIARANGLEKIAALLRQCSIREELYRQRYDDDAESKKTHSSVHTSYREELKFLYVKILMFQAKCLCHLAKGDTTKFFRDVTVWDDWDDFSAQIQVQSDRMKSIEEQWRDFKLEEEWHIKAERHNRKMDKLAPIANEISRIKLIVGKTQKDQHRRDLLKWLSSEDYSKRFNDIRERHESLTGDWLLKNGLYKSWKTESSSFLWLHGNAGSGKSYLSSTAIDDLESNCQDTPYLALAYYYFSFTDQNEQNANTMLSSIIRQLCGARPDTPDWLLNLGSAFRDKGAASPGLKHLEEALWKAADGFESVYLVIDALDECAISNEKRATMLKSIVKIQRSCPPNLHILVTSRKEPDIEAQFVIVLKSSTGHEVDLRQFREAVNNDISIFLAERFKSPEFHAISEENKLLATKTLIEKADGMFQYVALQLVELQNSFSENIPQLLANLPHGLEDTYVRMLQSIDPQYSTQAYRIIVWVAFSKRPLRSRDLAEAAIIDPMADTPFDESKRLTRLTEISGLLRLLPGILIEVGVRLEDRQIRFAHFSVQEFLLSTNISQLESVSQYSIKNDTGNAFIAECCLCYHMHASQICDYKTDLKRFPLWKYATKYWTYHMNDVVKENWTASLKKRCKYVLTPDSKIFKCQLQSYSPLKYYDPPRSSATFTPLSYVSTTGNLRIVSALLDELAEEDLVKYINKTSKGSILNALQGAVYKKQSECAKLLLNNGAEVNARGGLYHTTLQIAAQNGPYEIVTLLLDMGAEVNAQGGEYGNALQAAAYGGSENIVSLLLDMGAEVNAQGGYYGNALQAAASRENENIVSILLDRGAEVNAQGGKYGTALRAARNHKSSSSTVQLLIDHGTEECDVQSDNEV